MAKPAKAHPIALDPEQAPVRADIGDPASVWRLESESGATIAMNVFGGRVQVQANGPHAPLCPPARLTLVEAESFLAQLGKACASLRGIATRAE